MKKLCGMRPELGNFFTTQPAALLAFRDIFPVWQGFGKIQDRQPGTGLATIINQ